MCTIRKFEESVKHDFLNGEIPGFVHLYIGEEAIATGVCSALRKDDMIESTHRRPRPLCGQGRGCEPHDG